MMLSYCLKCGENTTSITPLASKAINGETILLSNCTVCNTKKATFIKKIERKGLLRNLVIRTILRDVLFLMQLHRINDIINKFLLAGDKFIPEMHLKQPQFAYSACGPSNKNKEKLQKFKKTVDIKYIYRNELDKACFNMIWVMEILET